MHARLFHIISENKVTSTEIDFHQMVPKMRMRLTSALVQGLNARKASGLERTLLQKLLAQHDQFFEALLKKYIGDLEIVLSKAFFAKKALGAYAQVTQFRGNE